MRGPTPDPTLAKPHSASPDVLGVQYRDIMSELQGIVRRLERLEESASTSNTKLIDSALPHPSLDKLAIAEAIADSIFTAQLKDKACQFEPDRPCDHCSMCNSRGF